MGFKFRSYGHTYNIPDFQSEDRAGHWVEFRCGQEHFVLQFLPATVKYLVKLKCHINLSFNLSFKAYMSWYIPPSYL